MAAFSEEDARARLERMVASDKEPTLDDTELDDLVALAKRADLYGLWPTDSNWTPTWDLNAAAAAGWLWKAAKVSGDFTFSDDAGSYNRREVFDMCERLADTYRKKTTGSIPTSRWQLPWEPDPYAWGTVVGNSPE